MYGAYKEQFRVYKHDLFFNFITVRIISK